jgi:hypothetical protein
MFFFPEITTLKLAIIELLLSRRAGIQKEKMKRNIRERWRIG